MLSKWSPLQADLTQAPQPLLLGQVLQPSPPWGPSTEVPPVCLCLSCTTGSKLDAVLQRWSYKCCAEETNHFLDLLAPLLLIQLRILLAFITARADCWLIFDQWATKTPETFPAELFPGLPVPSQYQCRGIVHAKCRVLHLSWLNIIRLLLASLGPSGWLLSPWVYWLVPSAWLYHWTCWGCTISHTLGYQ